MGAIYGYDQKYLAWGGEVSSGRELPARIDAAVEKHLRELARVVEVGSGAMRELDRREAPK